MVRSSIGGDCVSTNTNPLDSVFPFDPYMLKRYHRLETAAASELTDYFLLSMSLAVFVYGSCESVFVGQEQISETV